MAKGRPHTRRRTPKARHRDEAFETAIHAEATRRLVGVKIHPAAIETLREWGATRNDAAFFEDQKVARRLYRAMAEAVARAEKPGGNGAFRRVILSRIAPFFRKNGALLNAPAGRAARDPEAAAIVTLLGDRLDDKKLAAVHVLAFGIDANGYRAGEAEVGEYFESLRRRIKSAK
jgi:hypothetical protein